MPRYSYGDEVRKRVRRLLEAILTYVAQEFEYDQAQETNFTWQTQTDLVVKTKLRYLQQLTVLDKYPGNLSKEQIREALRLLQNFLGILEDIRVHRRGSEDWYFKLKLWSRDIEKNLKQFDIEWANRQPARSKARKPATVSENMAQIASVEPTDYENISLSGVKKFFGQEDELQTLHQALQQNDSIETTYIEITSLQTTCYQNIPLSGVVKFVGREKELQTLHQMLQQNDRVAIAAIAGMGGVGKTELALQYAITYRETYNGGICWLFPRVGDVGIQIVQFARTQLDVNPPEDLDLLAQVQYCFSRWCDGDVLLVLDDVTDYQQVYIYLPPSSSRFKVLITTRQHLGRIAQLSLDVLQPEVGLELLKSFLEETPERIERELTVANQLATWLGYLPLALELVGRYLARKQDLTLAEMLRRLQKKRLEQAALAEPEADMTSQRGVLGVFELSWQELADADKQLGCLLSLFAAAPIPWYLVEQCLPEKDEEEIEEIRDDKLLNLHLLQRKSEGVYQLHPLLREFFQYKLTGLEQAQELKRSLCRVMVAVAKEIPQTPTLEEITAVSPAIPHIAEVANHLIEYVSDEDLTYPFIGNARFYDGQGRYSEAEPLYLQALEISEQRLGVNHPQTITIRENLTNFLENRNFSN